MSHLWNTRKAPFADVSLYSGQLLLTYGLKSSGECQQMIWIGRCCPRMWHEDCLGRAEATMVMPKENGKNAAKMNVIFGWKI